MSWVPQKLNYSHEALADQILACPTLTDRELGKVFGRSPEWVGMVRRSDMFREYVLARRGEIVDPVLTATLEDRFNAMARRSLEVLMAKLDKPVEQVSDDLAIAAANLGAKAGAVGGFGAKITPITVTVDAGRIERLAERLTNLGAVGPAQEIEDAKVRELPQTGEGRPG